MAFAVTPVAAKDGTGTTIAGGVEFVDISGTGAGPWIIAKVLLDPAGANVQFVLSNNAAKTDLSSIAGTTAVTGHGTAAGALRVELPTDGTGIVGLAAGSAVIGHVITDTGSTTAITGNVTVVQGTGSSLHMVVDSGTITAVTDITNNVKTVGPTASGSSLTASPVTTGARAATALPTAVADAQVVNLMADKYGRAVNLPITIRDLAAIQTTTISASTAETTIITQIASTFNDLIALVISNTSSATNTRIDFRDTTSGSVLFSLESIGGAGPVGFAFAVPIPQTTVNTNWTAQCATSTTDIRILALYAKNK